MCLYVVGSWCPCVVDPPLGTAVGVVDAVDGWFGSSAVGDWFGSSVDTGSVVVYLLFDSVIVVLAASSVDYCLYKVTKIISQRCILCLHT